MSIEKLIEENTAAVNKNTAQLGEVLAALQGNTSSIDTLIKGRAEALEALTTKDAEPAKPATRTRKKKDEEPAASEEPADAVDEAAEADAADNAWNPDTSVEGMRAILTPYLTGTSDETEKTARVANIQSILAELGVQAINPQPGKTHIESDDDRRKAAFYVTRFAAGLPVDFKADYDFNADPLTQGAAEAASSDEDLVG